MKRVVVSGDRFGWAYNSLIEPDIFSNIYGVACRIVNAILIPSAIANQISRPGFRCQSGLGVRLIEDICFRAKYAYMINVWWVAAMEILDRSHGPFMNS